MDDTSEVPGVPCGLPWEELIVYGAEVFIQDVSLGFGCQPAHALPYAQLYGGHQLSSRFLLAHAASLYIALITLHFYLAITLAQLPPSHHNSLPLV